ncbi:MAG TPA: hypothetical protein VH092_03970 [Urbifossiella sp.]|jgi:hypothetical protein|nr:hypothetical protein [Urbifossiella sp.]
MTISRYKIMAGILGVSVGGLAALAGQCRPDTPHRSGDGPPGNPKTASAGSKPSAVLPPPVDLPVPTIPAGPVGVDLPSLPALPVGPGSPTPAKLPEFPAVMPVKAETPKQAVPPTPVVIPASGSALPDVPPALPGGVIRLPQTEPVVPTAPPKAIEPATAPLRVEPIATPPAPPAPAAVAPGSPALVPALPAPAVVTPPVPTPPTPAAFITPPLPADTKAPTAPPAAVAPTPAVEPIRASVPAPGPGLQQAVAASRFRILLRVGEGEPVFEVKSGDDLVLRVVCEKVDIKSPEKGQGPSSVVATGKVRFAGFGAEGTCDSLSFLAGTGEVAMTGSVRVQVKDKIGRVESELTSDRLQYRLDTNALPGTMRP